MTVFQEGLNALTQFITVIFIWKDCCHSINNNYFQSFFLIFRYIVLLTFASFHSFFSILYHIRMSLKLDSHPIDNKWRKHDQSSINIACIGYSLAISNNIFYALFVFFVKYYHINHVYDDSSTSFSRRMHIFTGACMYLLPMIIYDVNFFIISFGMLLVGCSIFVLNDQLMGYGSALFHLSLIPYHKNIITYINNY
uniref:Uncharacterized protein n=1 Tax=Florenciella sp. virus SA2 TaxID=3240092 RepID=A0AB39JEQ0_9VIRU